MKLNDINLPGLRDLFTDLRGAGSMDQCLEELSALVARILKAGDCVIILLSDDEAMQSLPRERAGFGFLSGCASSLRKSRPALVSGAEGPDAPRSAAMFSFIVLLGKTVGVIQAVSPAHSKGFDRDDLELLNGLTPIITKSIQVIQLQHVLRSQFTQLALIRANETSIRDLLAGAIHNPNQIARILAKSFYREMLNAGFSFNHILFAATEVISQLSTSVRKHSARRNLESLDSDAGVADIMAAAPFAIGVPGIRRTSHPVAQ